MINNRKLGSIAIAAVLMSASATSHAANKCNTFFTFDNRFSFPIEMPRDIRINGNRGPYTEALDKTYLVQGKSRRTTRKNRLQKVDHNTRATFSIRSIKIPSDSRGAIFPNNPRVGDRFDPPQDFEQELGFVKRNARCRDNSYVTFVFQPLPDTASNRNRVIALANQNPNATDDFRRDLLRRYMNIDPGTNAVYTY